MTETGSTIELTKSEMEKAKKEAKQQKGLLAIAKKQLAAREAERSKAAQELQEAVAEAEEATKEREIAEAEISRELATANTANGYPFAPSPDSIASAAQPLAGTPGSPSSPSGSTTAKSNNPFERLAAGSRSQSPFLPFANVSVPTPTATTSALNEGTTTDNPFTFDQAFGGEETRPGPDVEEPSTGPKGNGDPFTTKTIGKPSIAANEEVSEPSSDHDLFITPPTSALDTLGTNINAPITGRDAPNLLPLDAPSAVPSTDRPPEVHTDINSQLKELDAGESDSSDEDSEDETPLATLVGRSTPAPNKTEPAKEAPVSNGHVLPQDTTEATFPPVTTSAATSVEVQSTNPFPIPPAKDDSPPPASTSPFAASPEPPKVAAISDFDKVFGDLPSTAPAAESTFTFDNAFEDHFDFNKADPSASLPTPSVSSSSSAVFPPAPTSSSGIAKPPSSSSPRGSGFENAFSPQQSSPAPPAPVRPVSSVDGHPFLPPVPESKPFSFDQAFSPNLLPAPASANQTETPSTADATSPSFDDAFGLDIQRDSAPGTASSRASSIPQVTQSPVSTFPSTSPVQGSKSPRETLSFPGSLPPGAAPASPPPPRVSSPKGRSSTPKESVKEQTRHSKLSVSDLVQCRGQREITHCANIRSVCHLGRRKRHKNHCHRRSI
jgi:epidermal growth factor receptor substrate 15